MTTTDFIQKGMVFDFDNSTWLVEEEGTYKLENGQRVEIDNRRRNKWWCRQIDSVMDKPAVLMCFDAVFDNETFYKFRWPDKSNAGTQRPGTSDAEPATRTPMPGSLE